MTRFLVVVMGYSYEAISSLYDSGSVEVELGDIASLEEAGDWLDTEVSSRKSKQDLGRLFQLDLETVVVTLNACEIPTQTVLYNTDAVGSFCNARLLIEKLQFTYFQVRRCLKKANVVTVFLKHCSAKLIFQSRSGCRV